VLEDPPPFSLWTELPLVGKVGCESSPFMTPDGFLPYPVSFAASVRSGIGFAATHASRALGTVESRELSAIGRCRTEMHPFVLAFKFPP
jgi:hypothetical protein